MRPHFYRKLFILDIKWLESRKKRPIHRNPKTRVSLFVIKKYLLQFEPNPGPAPLIISLWVSSTKIRTKRKLVIIYVVMDLRVIILRFSCISILSMIKTLKIKKMEKLLQRNSFLAWKKYLHIKTLKFQLLDP